MLEILSLTVWKVGVNDNRVLQSQMSVVPFANAWSNALGLCYSSCFILWAM